MKALLLLLLAVPVLVTAQDDVSEFTESTIEALLTTDDTNSEDGASYENLVNFLSHPLDLNSVSSEELSVLNLLSPQQIKDLIDHRNEHGKFLSLYELQSIPDFDVDL